MLKRFFLVLLLFPVVVFSQTNVASWSLTSNANAVTQSYASAVPFKAVGTTAMTFSASGAQTFGWDNANFEHYKYYEIVVSATAGNIVNLNNLVFSHAAVATGGAQAPTQYTVRTYLSENNVVPGEWDFYYNNSNLLVAGESIAANPNKTVGLNVSLNSTQKLIIRFYARGGNNYNNSGWRFNANSLKITGSLMQPLAGTYIVGSAAGAHFPTLTHAIYTLNNIGVSAPVTFLLDNAVYNRAANESFPLVVTPYAGNTTHTVTIKPNTGKTVSIEATNLPSTTSNPAVFKLEGVDNFIINGSNDGSSSKDLTIYNNNPLNQARSVIWIASENSSNGVSNITVKNVNIRQFHNADDLSMGIYGGGSASLGTAAAAANSNVTIDNVAFLKVGQAVYVNGAASPASNNWVLSNNTVGATVDSEKPFMGFYLNNVSNYSIANNNIAGVYKGTTSYGPLHSAIYITGTSNGRIYNNIIKDVNNAVSNGVCAAIFINSGGNMVYNNMISNIKTNSTDNNNYNLDIKPYGIYMKSGAGNKFLFNTIHMNAATQGYTACMFIESGSGVTIQNNIFYNTQSTGVQYTLNTQIATIHISSNYNDFFSSSTTANLRRVADSYTLASWKSSTSLDAQSISVAPVFLAGGLFIDADAASNADLEGKGTPIAGITADIEGQVRNVTTPDMGADEFGTKCSGNTTWNGTSWNNGAPVDGTKNVMISGAYNTGVNGAIDACMLQINGSGSLTIGTGTTVIVQTDLKVSGILTIEDGGSLVQVEDNGKAEHSGSGQTIVKRKTTPLRQYDYTYWSSPVVGAEVASTTNGNPSIFYTYNPQAGWVWTADNAILAAGTGFISMAPENLNYSTPQIFTANFYGRPNTGTITKPTAVGYDLIGNPYPSAIDAEAFIDANPNISGTLYFWTHNTAMQWYENSSASYYSTDDYAKLNRTGSVRTSPNMNIPQGKIASGQGFFVDTKTAGTIVFNNSMRVKAAGSNSQFYRSAEVTPSTESSQAIERNRIWMSLTNDQGAYAQTLLGFVTGAADGFDNGYDGEIMDSGNFVMLYSLLGDKKLAIQGRSLAFNEADVIPLGFKSSMGGTLTISNELTDGFMQNQAVYLHDKLTGEMINLQEASYSFTTEPGTIENRFELKFVSSTLGTDVPALDKNNIIVATNGGQIEVKSTVEPIESITVYDINGKVIYRQAQINESTFRTTSINAKAQVLLVQVTTLENRSFTTKVVVK